MGRIGEQGQKGKTPGRGHEMTIILIPWLISWSASLKEKRSKLRPEMREREEEES